MFNIGEEVTLDEVFWKTYTVIKINFDKFLNVRISPTGNKLDSFWVNSGALQLV